MDICGQDCNVQDIVVCPEQGLPFMTWLDGDNVLLYITVKRK
jgi:hypothetical protein